MKINRNPVKNKTEIIPTLITMDVAGGVVIDGASRFLNYDNRKISVNSKGKTIYIYGEDLKITAYSKENISIRGTIEKIEFFEVK